VRASSAVYRVCVVAPEASDSGLLGELLHKEAAKESFCQTPHLTRFNPMAKPKTSSPVEDITRSILILRGHRVILERDLAAIYGVATKVLNQAVKRNSERFPEDFRFQLSGAEVAASRSQLVTLKPGRAGTLNELRHKLKDKVSQGHLNQLRFGQLCPTIVA
jgi:ORF6N domain